MDNNKRPKDFYKSYFDLINGKRNYSRETKCAILRAVFYVINADNRITEAEERHFIKLAMEYDNDPSIMADALRTMSDDEMLRLLENVSRKDLSEILENAAKADGEISVTEMETIIGIMTSTPSARQEINKYDNLLKKYEIL